MKTQLFVIDYASRSDWFTFYFFGDKHNGTIFCHTTGINKITREIKQDPHAYYFEMGDPCEFIAPDDPRFEKHAIAPWINKDRIILSQAEYEINQSRPISHKCIGRHRGNHEGKYSLRYQQDIHAYICEKLKVTDLTVSAFTRIVFRRSLAGSTQSWQFDVVTKHPWKGCLQTPGSRANKITKNLNNFDADVIAIGHYHDIQWKQKPKAIRLDNRLRTKSDVQYGCMTGCWFKGYQEGDVSSYVEEADYDPTVIGCPFVRVKPDMGYIEKGDRTF